MYYKSKDQKCGKTAQSNYQSSNHLKLYQSSDDQSSDDFKQRYINNQAGQNKYTQNKMSKDTSMENCSIFKNIQHELTEIPQRKIRTNEKSQITSHNLSDQQQKNTDPRLQKSLTQQGQYSLRKYSAQKQNTQYQEQQSQPQIFRQFKPIQSNRKQVNIHPEENGRKTNYKQLVQKQNNQKNSQTLRLKSKKVYGKLEFKQKNNIVQISESSSQSCNQQLKMEQNQLQQQYTQRQCIQKVRSEKIKGYHEKDCQISEEQIQEEYQTQSSKALQLLVQKYQNRQKIYVIQKDKQLKSIDSPYKFGTSKYSKNLQKSQSPCTNQDVFIGQRNSRFSSQNRKNIQNNNQFLESKLSQSSKLSIGKVISSKKSGQQYKNAQSLKEHNSRLSQQKGNNMIQPKYNRNELKKKCQKLAYKMNEADAPTITQHCQLGAFWGQKDHRKRYKNDKSHKNDKSLEQIASVQIQLLQKIDNLQKMIKDLNQIRQSINKKEHSNFANSQIEESARHSQHTSNNINKCSTPPKVFINKKLEENYQVKLSVKCQDRGGQHKAQQDKDKLTNRGRSLEQKNSRLFSGGRKQVAKTKQSCYDFNFRPDFVANMNMEKGMPGSSFKSSLRNSQTLSAYGFNTSNSKTTSLETSKQSLYSPRTHKKSSLLNQIRLLKAKVQALELQKQIPKRQKYYQNQNQNQNSSKRIAYSFNALNKQKLHDQNSRNSTYTKRQVTEQGIQKNASKDEHQKRFIVIKQNKLQNKVQQNKSQKRHTQKYQRKQKQLKTTQHKRLQQKEVNASYQIKGPDKQNNKKLCQSILTSEHINLSLQLFRLLRGCSPPRMQDDKNKLGRKALEMYINLQGILKVGFSQIRQLKIQRYEKSVTFEIQQFYEGKYDIMWEVLSMSQNKHKKRSLFYCGQLVCREQDGIETKIKSGQGIEILQEQFCYVGSFKGNQKEGQGMMYFFNGDNYSGQCNDNQLNERGRYVTCQGDVYQGDFKAGRKHGQGVEKFRNGDSYKGSYKEGLFMGQGNYKWSNGSSYKGNFYKGHLHSKGLWKSGQGDVYQGNYFKDHKHGYGVYRWKNGIVYEGQFQYGHKCVNINPKQTKFQHMERQFLQQ